MSVWLWHGKLRECLANMKGALLRKVCGCACGCVGVGVDVWVWVWVRMCDDCTGCCRLQHPPLACAPMPPPSSTCCRPWLLLSPMAPAVTHGSCCRPWLLPAAVARGCCQLPSPVAPPTAAACGRIQKHRQSPGAMARLTLETSS